MAASTPIRPMWSTSKYIAPTSIWLTRTTPPTTDLYLNILFSNPTIYYAFDFSYLVHDSCYESISIGIWYNHLLKSSRSAGVFLFHLLYTYFFRYLLITELQGRAPWLAFLGALALRFINRMPSDGRASCVFSIFSHKLAVNVRFIYNYEYNIYKMGNTIII